MWTDDVDGADVPDEIICADHELWMDDGINVIYYGVHSNMSA